MLAASPAPPARPDLIESVIALIREGRPTESVVAVPTSTPGVHFLRVYSGEDVTHAMLLLDEATARQLPGSARMGISLASRFMDRGQVWLVVPLAYVPTAQSTLREQGYEGRAGGYDRDAEGRLRLRWW